ncbi:hypothetical protein TNCV_5021241 [Trichonephila clavipes]|nr:hypothetical protein TNCV_5021241 [Trichonephila clavipes]
MKRRTNMDDLIPIPHSSHNAACKAIKICAASHCYACPYHRFSAGVVVDFSDIGVLPPDRRCQIETPDIHRLGTRFRLVASPGFNRGTMQGTVRVGQFHP